MTATADYVIIGAGIVGLTTALELKRRRPAARVVVLEKEPEPGRHSSGRNSGVLHSGVYYPPESLKAQVCTAGAREMEAFCRERGLPVNRLGKVLVPVNAADAGQLDLLTQRGTANGLVVERLNEVQLRELEPATRSATGEALFVPQTAVVDSAAVMRTIVADVAAAGIELRCGARLQQVDGAHLTIDGEHLSVGHAINTAGLHADSVAHLFKVGQDYTLLPFKGIYYKLRPDSGIPIRHLIYPVPDLRFPFLGVHTTTSIAGDVYVGPTAIPALGRENYRGLRGAAPADLIRIGGLIAEQWWANRNNFRRLAVTEAQRYLKPAFAKAARALLPALRTRDLQACDKVGLRAQMLDRRTGALVTDFLVEAGPHSTHVLNAISPAFTSAFPLARHLCDRFIPN
jgi:L-2-hydroxyglutarate oxidase LhgO